MKNKIIGVYDTACTRLYFFNKKYSSKFMLMLGLGLLTIGIQDLSHANANNNGSFKGFQDPNFIDMPIRVAVGNLFAFIEGAFGALIMVIAGLGAIVSAAMGAYRAAVSMIVVAVGAFILRALVSLFFGDQFFTVGTGPAGTLTPE